MSESDTDVVQGPNFGPNSSQPPPSPLYHALNADRYARQQQIRDYEDSTGRRLMVFMGGIFSHVIAPFADAVHDLGHNEPLDLIVASLGGDGETAFRLATMCREGRDDFRVVVPDRAMSAATLLAMSAESILMSDSSALGPIDPQLQLPSREEFVPAKDIIEIVENLQSEAKKKPEAVMWFANMLGDIDAIIYQRAKASLDRAKELAPDMLSMRRGSLRKRKSDIVKALHGAPVHAAVIGHQKAHKIGLPVEYVEPSSPDWELFWRLYTQYQVRTNGNHLMNVVEGGRISLIWGLGSS